MRPGALRSASVGLPRFRALRIYWICVVIVATFLWSFSGLTYFHFVFFGVLAFGIYLSYARYSLPLIVYLSMMLLYWIIAPLIQKITGVQYYTWSIDIPDFGPKALVFVLTHFLGILLGFQFRRINTSPRPVFKTEFSVTGVTLVMLLLVALIMLIGFETIVTPRADQGTSEALNYAIMARNIVKTIPAFLMSYFVLESGKGLKANARIMIFVFLVMCLLIVSNPVNTPRFLSLFGVFLILIIYAIKSSRLALLSWGLAMAPAYAIFLLGVTSAMRNGLEKFNMAFVFASLQSLEFSSYSIFLDALDLKKFPSSNYLVSHLFVVVPRSIWPGKADSIGIDTAQLSGYVYTNVGLNSFVDAFADYGLLGLFAASIGFGILAKNLNPIFEIASFRSRRFMYGAVFTAMMPMLFRGDLSTAMLAFYPAIVVYESIRFTTRFRMMSGAR